MLLPVPTTKLLVVFGFISLALKVPIPGMVMFSPRAMALAISSAREDSSSLIVRGDRLEEDRVTGEFFIFIVYTFMIRRV